MIPNLIHFIFGLKEDFGGIPFSFIHFLSVYMAWKVNSPKKVFFHYGYEPTGFWWQRAKPLLTLNKVEIPNEIFGNQLLHFAHKADVLRLQLLKQYGGIYLDLDVICLKTFDPLFKYDFVMGIEEGQGLCNAVILSRPESEFINIWFKTYKHFDGEKWNYHSVKLPYILAKKNPSRIHIEDKYSFFYPLYDDPVNLYFWGEKAPLIIRAKGLSINFAKSIRDFLHDKRTKGGRSYHASRDKQWHYIKLVNSSYCVHLWERYWFKKYLANISPEWILNSSSNFALAIKNILSNDEILKMTDSDI